MTDIVEEDKMDLQAAMRSLEDVAREQERERCAKIADAYADRCDRGGPMSSMAEDNWGSVASRNIARAIRAANG
jgi:hypothetical protein